MGASLPSVGLPEMAAALAASVDESLSSDVVARLHAHYEELRRWNPRLSLVGPGTADDVLSRHYSESLAALPWLAEDDGDMVDIGSGAGFPGWVLAAARPLWSVTLVEAQERKWAFLESASRRAGLSVRCLNARVGPRLPEGFPERVDRLTLRALRLSSTAWRELESRLSPEARVLWWAGEGLEVPEGLEIEARRRLPAADRRYLWVAKRTDP